MTSARSLTEVDPRICECGDRKNMRHRVCPGCRRYCECGDPKPPRKESCPRCAYLDGDNHPNHVDLSVQVIAALRGTDGLSLLGLCQALRRDTGRGNGRRHMLRVVRSLLRQRRIRRFWCDGGDNEVAMVSWSYRDAAKLVSLGGSGCWLYALDGLTQREWRDR